MKSVRSLFASIALLLLLSTFSDGYEYGDISKQILDTGYNFTKDIAKKVVDLSPVGQISKKIIGVDPLGDVAKRLIDADVPQQAVKKFIKTTLDAIPITGILTAALGNNPITDAADNIISLSPEGIRLSEIIKKLVDKNILGNATKTVLGVNPIGHIVSQIIDGNYTRLFMKTTGLGKILQNLADNNILSKFVDNVSGQNLIGRFVKRFIDGTILKDVLDGHVFDPAAGPIINVIKDVGIALNKTGPCAYCTATFDYLLVARRFLKLNKNILLTVFKTVCAVVGKQFMGEGVCYGLVEANMDEILYILDKRFVLGSSVCAVIFQDSGCFGILPAPWKVKVVPQTAKPIKKQREPTQNPIKILHLTDIHFDPNVDSKAEGACTDPVCCEGDSLDFSVFGKCVLSKSFFSKAFDNIKLHQNQIDYIYVTGDMIRHKFWTTSKEGNARGMTEVMKLFKKSFGNAKVFPILGNHEPHPSNLYAPGSLNNSTFSTQWLFNFTAELWKNVLPKGTDLETIRKGGYYTAKEGNGPRIIALNSNVAYILNYWILYEDSDYYGQLQWFADTLQRAEKAGETVHVLSHIPSGSGDCYVRWSQQFKKIMERYSHIITGVFSGHTHFDEFYVYYKGRKPINMGFSGGSITPYSGVNPSFKTYTVASDTHEVLDFDAYYVNLAKVRATKAVHWIELYSFKSQYDIAELTPKSLNDIATNMATNSTLRNIYYENKVRRGEASLKRGCDTNCQRKSICDIVTNVYSDKWMCHKILANYER